MSSHVGTPAGVENSHAFTEHFMGAGGAEAIWLLGKARWLLAEAMWLLVVDLCLLAEAIWL